MAKPARPLDRLQELVGLHIEASQRRNELAAECQRLMGRGETMLAVCLGRPPREGCAAAIGEFIDAVRVVLEQLVGPPAAFLRWLRSRDAP
jgi:hypothetical protein